MSWSVGPARFSSSHHRLFPVDCSRIIAKAYFPNNHVDSIIKGQYVIHVQKRHLLASYVRGQAARLSDSQPARHHNLA